VIVPPLPRQHPAWFNSYLPCFVTYLINEVSKDGNGQIQVLAPFVALASSFDPDGVHLNADSGFTFIQYMMNGLDQLLPDVPTEAALPPVQTHTTPAVSESVVGGPSLLEAAVASLTSLTGTMRAESTARRLQDNLIFARLNSNLFVANSVTLTTRVRIEIMRAIAKLLTTENEEAYVQSFSSRPMLHYQATSRYAAPGTNRSYSFVEAVGRWGDQLSTVSLLPAYRRARPAFIGCLEQYFVVLKESEPQDDPSSGFDQLFGTGSNSVSIGRGRGRGGGFRPARRPGRGRSSSVRGRGWAQPTPFQTGPAPSSSRKRLASGDVQTTPSKKKDSDEDADITDVTLIAETQENIEFD